MPIRYCSKHERLAIVNLFGQKEGGWRDFPLENMHAIKRLYAFCSSANIQAAAYKVNETWCDQCAALGRARVRAQRDTLDPPQ